MSDRNREIRDRIGVPYAWSCLGCYRAVICPVCGEHVGGGLATNNYAKHFEAKHIKDGVEDPSRPFAGSKNAAPKFCSQITAVP